MHFTLGVLEISERDRLPHGQVDTRIGSNGHGIGVGDGTWHGCILPDVRRKETLTTLTYFWAFM